MRFFFKSIYKETSLFFFAADSIYGHVQDNEITVGRDAVSVFFL